MASAAKVAANRRNAARSTGPRSAAGKKRSSRNAFRHGLAIPIQHDVAMAANITALARQLAMGEPGPQEAAAYAAEADAELARVDLAKAKLLQQSIAAADNTADGSAEDGPARGFEQAAAGLLKLERYTRHAWSRRHRALRALNARQRDTAKKSICRNNVRFVQSTLQLDIDALVKAARVADAQRGHPSETYRIDLGRSERAHGDDRFGGTSAAQQQVSILVRVRDNSSNPWQISITLMQTAPVWQDFSVVKISTAVGGGHWVAICPTTGKRVAHLYWVANETAIQSRHALGLHYRSRHEAHQDAPLASPHPEPPMADHAKPEHDLGPAKQPDYPTAAATPECACSRLTPSSTTAKLKRTRRRASNNPNDGPALLARSSQRQPFAAEQAASVTPAGPPASASLDDTRDGTGAAISAPRSTVDRPTQSQAEASPTKAAEDEFAKDFELGDKLFLRGKFLEAAAIYHRIVARCKAKPAADATRSALEGIVDRAIHSVGGLAFQLVRGGDCVRALDQIDQAIAERPQWVWLEAIRAHALMFCANVTAARTIYQRHRGVRLDEDTTWEHLVRAGFAELRKIGRKHPLMDHIETEFEHSHY